MASPEPQLISRDRVVTALRKMSAGSTRTRPTNWNAIKPRMKLESESRDFLAFVHSQPRKIPFGSESRESFRKYQQLARKSEQESCFTFTSTHSALSSRKKKKTRKSDQVNRERKKKIAPSHCPHHESPNPKTHPTHIYFLYDDKEWVNLKAQSTQLTQFWLQLLQEKVVVTLSATYIAICVTRGTY